MRIAMLATSRHPIAEPYAGGQESHTALLARGLRELGHHVRMYAPAGSDPGVADELVPYRGLPDLSAVAAPDPSCPSPTSCATTRPSLRLSSTSSPGPSTWSTTRA